MAVSAPPELYRLSREKYDEIVESGLLEDVPVELLDGYLVDAMTQGEEHAALIGEVMRWFIGAARLLRVQLPLAASPWSEPEPDVALAEHRGIAHPTTALLAVEVVVTARRAAELKTPIYAAADVERYWIVDVPGRCVVEHADPSASGYASTRTLRGEDLLEPPAGLPARTVGELFATALGG